MPDAGLEAFPRVCVFTNRILGVDINKQLPRMRSRSAWGYATCVLILEEKWPIDSSRPWIWCYSVMS